MAISAARQSHVQFPALSSCSSTLGQSFVQRNSPERLGATRCRRLRPEVRAIANIGKRGLKLF
jgi:hypothetical protein